ncbi:hypothetical protein K461DRAFT_324807 [Myriangium duriaei CBS 260.36]|uniref:Uncharacterized protein n=1 Tax=Myriangium duriaei CBS 260.36 TaxID=1168546 RepID=A0A9P4IV72_9PEZI|nr:hypothetical protein K461DRAFT_324807 [Myriangium duriaei CBS 260.36]
MAVVVPTVSLVALALAIVKTKPAGQTIQDYINTLRRHVTCASSDCPRCRNVNPDTHWQRECRRLQDELDKSVATCAALRVQNRRLTSSVIDGLERSSQKRTANPTLAAGGNKRTKTTKNSITEAIPLVTEIQQMMGLLYDLEQLLAPSKPHTQRLSPLICQTASALSDILQEYIQTACSVDDVGPRAQATPSLADGLRVASRVFAVLIQGYDMLDLHSANQQQMGTSVYHVVRLFSTILSCLLSICGSKVTEDAIADTATTGTKRKQTASSSSRSSNLDHPSTLLVQYLSTMYSSLDPNKQHHAAIFEGFTYHVLQPVGQILNIYTSDESSSSQNPPSSGVFMSEDAARCAAPYLLNLLKQALSQVPRSFRLPQRASQLSTSGSVASRLLPRASLTSHALAKLQRTLVHAVLGDELSPLDAAAAWLRAPEIGGDMAGAKKGKMRKKEMTPAVFKGELWAVLGWEILAFEGELAEFIATE